MKKRIAAIFLAAVFMLCAAGCSDIFAYEYTYSAEYRDETAYDSIEGGADIKSQPQLKKAILDLVYAGEPDGMLRFSNYSGNPADDLTAVSYEIRTTNPICAYAVSNIEYELSRIVSYYTAEIRISYTHSPEEIAGMRQISTVGELRAKIGEAMTTGETGMTFHIYSNLVNEDVISNIADECFLANPMIMLSEPEVQAKGYPEDGANRIYEVSFVYDLDEDGAEEMREKLAENVEGVASNIQGDNGALTALACASYVYGNCTYDGTNGGTAYDAFVQGSSGSRGVALAYEALCSELGVECRVVRGKLGALGTDEHYWNIIEADGSYYHVDVSRIGEEQIENVFLVSDDRMWGLYTWAPEAYPSCDGALTYNDLITGAQTAEKPENETQMTENK